MNDIKVRVCYNLQAGEKIMDAIVHELLNGNRSTGYIKIDIFIFVCTVIFAYYIARRNGWNFLISTLSGFILTSVLYILGDIAWEISEVLIKPTISPNKTLIACNYLAKSFFFIAAMAPGYSWFAYIIQETKRSNQKRILLFAKLFPAIQALLLIINIFTKNMFYIAPNAIYHESRYFFLLFIFIIILPASASIYAFHIARQSKNILEKEHLRRYGTFPIFCIVAATFQTLFRSIPFAACAIFIAAFLLYLNILEEQASIDYLTGINNRKTFIKNLIRLHDGGLSALILPSSILINSKR
ncbi:hypothetical protein [Treponema sp. Marseille-Q4130]|uniref:hypothetical protein n=1 Tax=Treponema sp. Marseille-Q4130 TaxID=2766702 RepID=UPI0016528071|nr:hypothetical protein [Treponema sp. Marseille-Q4130]MBC6718922.1 hypothetical protein [Treponema sp. Marseille-Q4130]